MNDEKSITNWSKFSDESEVLIKESKQIKHWWIEVYWNDHITLKKKLILKWSERQ